MGEIALCSSVLNPFMVVLIHTCVGSEDRMVFLSLLKVNVYQYIACKLWEIPLEKNIREIKPSGGLSMG